MDRSIVTVLTLLINMSILFLVAIEIRNDLSDIESMKLSVDIIGI